MRKKHDRCKKWILVAVFIVSCGHTRAETWSKPLARSAEENDWVPVQGKCLSCKPPGKDLDAQATNDQIGKVLNPPSPPPPTQVQFALQKQPRALLNNGLNFQPFHFPGPGHEGKQQYYPAAPAPLVGFPQPIYQLDNQHQFNFQSPKFILEPYRGMLGLAQHLVVPPPQYPQNAAAYPSFAPHQPSQQPKYQQRPDSINSIPTSAITPTAATKSTTQSKIRFPDSGDNGKLIKKLPEQVVPEIQLLYVPVEALNRGRNVKNVNGLPPVSQGIPHLPPNIAAYQQELIRPIESQYQFSQVNNPPPPPPPRPDATPYQPAPIPHSTSYPSATNNIRNNNIQQIFGHIYSDKQLQSIIPKEYQSSYLQQQQQPQRPQQQLKQLPYTQAYPQITNKPTEQPTYKDYIRAQSHSGQNSFGVFNSFETDTLRYEPTTERFVTGYTTTNAKPLHQQQNIFRNVVSSSDQFSTAPRESSYVTVKPEPTVNAAIYTNNIRDSSNQPSAINSINKEIDNFNQYPSNTPPPPPPSSAYYSTIPQIQQQQSQQPSYYPYQNQIQNQNQQNYFIDKEPSQYTSLQSTAGPQPVPTATSPLSTPTTTTFTTASPKLVPQYSFSDTATPSESTPNYPVPHQPPLSVYMEKYPNSKINDVLSLLKNSKTVPVLDTIEDNAPQVFVGPSELQPPNGYVKFDLPYLSSLDSNRIERMIDRLPFFVAPLNFKPPAGYSKVPFPAPHIGSVVVSNSSSIFKESLHEKLPPPPSKYSTLKPAPTYPFFVESDATTASSQASSEFNNLLDAPFITTEPSLFSAVPSKPSEFTATTGQQTYKPTPSKSSSTTTDYPKRNRQRKPIHRGFPSTTTTSKPIENTSPTHYQETIQSGSSQHSAFNSFQSNFRKQTHPPDLSSSPEIYQSVDISDENNNFYNQKESSSNLPLATEYFEGQTTQSTYPSPSQTFNLPGRYENASDLKYNKSFEYDLQNFYNANPVSSEGFTGDVFQKTQDVVSPTTVNTLPGSNELDVSNQFVTNYNNNNYFFNEQDQGFPPSVGPSASNSISGDSQSLNYTKGVVNFQNIKPLSQFKNSLPDTEVTYTTIPATADYQPTSQIKERPSSYEVWSHNQFYKTNPDTLNYFTSSPSTTAKYQDPQIIPITTNPEYENSGESNASPKENRPSKYSTGGLSTQYPTSEGEAIATSAFPSVGPVYEHPQTLDLVSSTQTQNTEEPSLQTTQSTTVISYTRPKGKRYRYKTSTTPSSYYSEDTSSSEKSTSTTDHQPRKYGVEYSNRVAPNRYHSKYHHEGESNRDESGENSDSSEILKSNRPSTIRRRRPVRPTTPITSTSDSTSSSTTDYSTTIGSRYRYRNKHVTSTPTESIRSRVRRPTTHAAPSTTESSSIELDNNNFGNFSPSGASNEVSSHEALSTSAAVANSDEDIRHKITEKKKIKGASGGGQYWNEPVHQSLDADTYSSASISVPRTSQNAISDISPVYNSTIEKGGKSTADFSSFDFSNQGSIVTTQPSESISTTQQMKEDNQIRSETENTIKEQRQENQEEDKSSSNGEENKEEIIGKEEPGTQKKASEQQDDKKVNPGRRRGTWVRKIRVKRPHDVFETAESQNLAHISDNALKTSSDSKQSSSSKLSASKDGVPKNHRPLEAVVEPATKKESFGNFQKDFTDMLTELLTEEKGEQTHSEKRNSGDGSANTDSIKNQGEEQTKEEEISTEVNGNAGESTEESESSDVSPKEESPAPAVDISPKQEFDVSPKEEPAIIGEEEQATTNTPSEESFSVVATTTPIPDNDADDSKVVATSTTTEISLETEICYRGKCVKTKKSKASDLLPID